MTTPFHQDMKDISEGIQVINRTAQRLYNHYGDLIALCREKAPEILEEHEKNVGATIETTTQELIDFLKKMGAPTDAGR